MTSQNSGAISRIAISCSKHNAAISWMDCLIINLPMLVLMAISHKDAMLIAHSDSDIICFTAIADYHTATTAGRAYPIDISYILLETFRSLVEILCHIGHPTCKYVKGKFSLPMLCRCLRGQESNEIQHFGLLCLWQRIKGCFCIHSKIHKTTPLIQKSDYCNSSGDAMRPRIALAAATCGPAR